jgi:MFS family permease
MSVVGESLRETGSSLSMVWRNHGLRRVNLGFVGSAIGDWAYATAIVVWAYGVGGATAVGVWGTVRLVLMAVVTPFASVFVDRYSRKAIMVTTDLLRALVIAICAFLIWIDEAPIVVFVLATVAALLAAPFRPAVAALLPNLAEKPEELTAANGTSSTIDSLSFFIGPAIGGLLLTVTSVPVVLLFDVLTFLWSAFMVWGIRVPAKAPKAEPALVSPDGGIVEEPEEEKETFVHEVTAGFTAIKQNRDLLVVSAVYAAQTVVAGASIVFGVEMAVQMTDFGPTGVGYLDSVFGIGAIVGGLVALGRASKQTVATDFGWGVMLWAVPLLVAAAFYPALWAAFAAMLVMGFGNPFADINAVTIVQRLTDDRVMGRVFGALETVLIAAMALGSIIMPLLVAAIGLRWGIAVLGAAIAIIVLPAFPRLRRLNTSLREPESLVLLRGLPLFAPLEPKSLELVAQQMKRVEVPAGATVIREGDAGDLFYVVESGSLTASFQGRTLSQQGPGDPFGEIALLRDVPRTATVAANEPSVLWSLERAPFLDAVTGNSEVSGQADDLVARRIPTY